MKKDTIPQTWEEKFKNYNVGEEYLYSAETTEQIENASKAVDMENLKGEKQLKIKSGRVKFTITCGPKTT